MRVVTWNVNGIRKREKELLELVDQEKPDVMCLQEIKCNPEQLPPGLAGLMGLPDYFSFWHGKGGYSGVSVHLKKSRFAEVSFSHPSFDSEARVVEARAVSTGPTPSNFSFISMYVPNGGKDFDAKMDFLRELAAWSKSLVTRESVVCGDMNVARSALDVHESQRNTRVIGQRPDERELFEKLFAPGLVDVGRALHPSDDALFSWWPYWNNARQRNIGWRLDLVIAVPSIASKARSHRVLRDFGLSDHAPVVVDFEL